MNDQKMIRHRVTFSCESSPDELIEHLFEILSVSFEHVVDDEWRASTYGGTTFTLRRSTKEGFEPSAFNDYELLIETDTTNRLFRKQEKHYIEASRFPEFIGDVLGRRVSMPRYSWKDIHD